MPHLWGRIGRGELSGRDSQMGGSVFAAIAAGMLAGQPAAEAAPCSLAYSAGPPITAVLRERGFGFETYDRLCAAAREHGLELIISGTSGVQSERAYGWAAVTARRTATGAASARDHLSTHMDTTATEAAAADMLYGAVNDAANRVLGELDVHLRSIAEEEARLRAVFSTNNSGNGRQ